MRDSVRAVLDQISQAADGALIEGLRQPGGTVDTAGLWCFYMDHEFIRASVLGVHGVEPGTADDIYLRRIPANWKHDIVNVFNDRLDSLYTRLSELMLGASDDASAELEMAHYVCMAGVTRRVTERAIAGDIEGVTLTDDFTVFCLEEQVSEEFEEWLLRLSADDDRLRRVGFEIDDGPPPKQPTL